jgi:hypothetical protein
MEEGVQTVLERRRWSREKTIKMEEVADTAKAEKMEKGGKILAEGEDDDRTMKVE